MFEFWRGKGIEALDIPAPKYVAKQEGVEDMAQKQVIKRAVTQPKGGTMHEEEKHPRQGQGKQDPNAPAGNESQRAGRQGDTGHGPNPGPGVVTPAGAGHGGHADCVAKLNEVIQALKGVTSAQKPVLDAQIAVLRAVVQDLGKE